MISSRSFRNALICRNPESIAPSILFDHGQQPRSRIDLNCSAQREGIASLSKG